MANKKADRRRHERFSIKQSTVAFKPAGPLGSLGKKNVNGNVLINMGRGGAQFTTPSPLKPGAKVRLSISIPAFIGDLTLTAKVIWQRRFDGMRKYRAGVEFIRADKKTWQRIDMGHETAYRSITAGIFQFGVPDAILQMWAAFL